jgi:acetylornithine deacetylase/succinyl-diaminopimelate desuccinylase-like protein
MLRIPAPSFGEAERAAWFLERFRALGLADPRIDAVGNVVAELRRELDATHGPVVLISAHLDTVFPAGTDVEPTESEGRILGPGACDNGAGLSGLLGLAAALIDARFLPEVPILFAANVGEEGEGDLRGMRHLFIDGAYAGRIAAAIALEGGGSSAVITRALASRRFRVTVTGPGGHSWTDAGAPNPILQLGRGLVDLGEIELGGEREASELQDLGNPAKQRTTLNVGLISGGTSVNSIPANAVAHLDLRSTDSCHLDAVERRIRETLTRAIPDAALRIETIGNRPGGALPESSALLATLRAVDRHLNLRTDPGLGSTDANIPLSLGIPAIAIGGGGIGGGIHTLQEWYDPTGRQAALRRVLLTLLDTATQAAPRVED